MVKDQGEMADHVGFSQPQLMLQEGENIENNTINDPIMQQKLTALFIILFMGMIVLIFTNNRTEEELMP